MSASWRGGAHELEAARKSAAPSALIGASNFFELAVAAAISLVHTGQPLLPLKLRAFLDFAAPLLKTALSRSAL